MLLIDRSDEYIPGRRFHVDQLCSILMFCTEEAKCLESVFVISSEERNEVSMNRHLTCEIRKDNAMKIRVLRHKAFTSV
jgi:hypothetical protein